MALTVSKYKDEKGTYSEKRVYVFTKFKRTDRHIFQFLEQDKQPNQVEKTNGQFLNIFNEQENEMVQIDDEFYALVSYVKDSTKDNTRDLTIYFEHIMPIFKESE